MAASERALNLDRAAYVATQGARVAWYSAHYALARSLSGPITPRSEPSFKPKSRAGDGKAIRDEFLRLFARDRVNIEAGLYPAPDDFALRNLPRLLKQSRQFFADLPAVDKRRLARRGGEVRESNESTLRDRDRYPAYYLQNFHYQTGGWLTRESAELYDTQVETLFAGAGDAMRRIGLGLLLKALPGGEHPVAGVLARAGAAKDADLLHLCPCTTTRARPKCSRARGKSQRVLRRVAGALCPENSQAG